MRTITLSIILVGAFCLTAKAKDKIRILTENYPPYSFIENNEAKGIATELVKEIIKEAKLTGEIEIYPWARSYKIFKSEPNAMGFALVKTPDREKEFKWVDTLIPINVFAYRLKSRKDIQIKNFEDLKKYSIGVIRDGGDHKMLTKMGFKNIHPVTNVEQNIKKLEKGRIDVTLLPDISFKYYVTHFGFSLDRFEPAYQANHISSDTYMVFSKSTPDEMVERVQKAAKKVKDSGRFAKIVDTQTKKLTTIIKNENTPIP